MNYEGRYSNLKWTISKTSSAAKKTNKPCAIIANTIKGKGVSFMENQAGWHGKAPNDEQLAEDLKTIEKVLNRNIYFDEAMEVYVCQKIRKLYSDIETMFEEKR